MPVIRLCYIPSAIHKLAPPGWVQLPSVMGKTKIISFTTWVQLCDEYHLKEFDFFADLVDENSIHDEFGGLLDLDCSDGGFFNGPPINLDECSSDS